MGKMFLFTRYFFNFASRVCCGLLNHNGFQDTIKSFCILRVFSSGNLLQMGTSYVYKLLLLSLNLK